MMTISDKSVSTVFNSSSLIESHATQIAKTMYILLFDLHPEYQKFFHNAPSNQHQLLSSTISAYAVNIKNIRVLMPALEKIAQTHIRVGVKPEHYAVIEHMILLSFKVVLQEKASEEMIEAWSEAIQFVASILMDLESKLYTLEDKV